MASLGIRSHCEQLVADAANGDEPPRPAGRLLDLASQVGDVDVARALIADVRRVPEVLHDLAPGVDPLRLLREEGEQAELRRREPDRPPVDPHLVPVDVELERADAADAAARGAIELAATQDRPYAANEPGDRERLGDVVVGPRLEAEHTVDLGVHRGQDQDRDVALAAQAAADLDPREAGQADVEDEHVVAVLRPGRLERRLAVAGGVDLEAGGAQRVGDGVDDRRFVVDDQDAVAHAANTRAARSRSRTVVPRRGADSISSREPIASAAAATMASPSPKPPDVSSPPR